MRELVLSLLVSLAALGQAPIPSHQELKFPPLRPVRIPHVEQCALPNGMRVYLLENHELPLVSGLALVRTGNLFEPPNKVGLAGITGSVMRSGGTRRKNGNDLDVELENIAASVESSIGETSGQVAFSALRENTDQVLGIFKDVLTAPAFPQDKIDLAKTQARSHIARRNDDPEEIAVREFTDTVYGKNTPYGWRVEYRTISNITRDDIVAFHRRYYFPANIMLAVYGDFSTPVMKAKLERLFGTWGVTQPPVPPFPAVQSTPESGVFVATKLDVNQSVFYIGHLGGVLSDKNNPALEIMADILGGGFSSRLFMRVRTNLGYAYSISADWSAAYDHPGLFTIAGSTKSNSTTEAIQVVRQEVEKMRTSEVRDSELRTAKQTALNSFIFNFDTPSKTLSRLLRYEYFGYPKDFIFRYQKAVEAVTKADVLLVARRYLRPKEFTIVVVGNPAAFGKPLTALNLPLRPIDLTIPQPSTTVAEK